MAKSIVLIIYKSVLQKVIAESSSCKVKAPKTSFYRIVEQFGLEETSEII